jgi:hypothetical protein
MYIYELENKGNEFFKILKIFLPAKLAKQWAVLTQNMYSNIGMLI